MRRVIKKVLQSESEFVIGILHRHGKELGTSLGILPAKDGDDALRKAELWIARKKRDHSCKSYGDICEVSVRKAYSGLNSAGLAASAEEIFGKTTPNSK